MHIIVHQEVSLPAPNIILNVKIFHEEIQKIIEIKMPGTEEVYLLDNKEFIFIFTGTNKRYPYTRLTIEY